MKYTVYQIKNSITDNERAERRSNRIFLAIMAFLLLVFIAVAYIRTFVFFSVNVSGTSMNQTLYNNDLLIVNKQKNPSRYDVVVINAYGVDPVTKDKDALYIKRVVALEGEDVWTAGGKLYYSYQNANGEIVDVELDDSAAYNKDDYYLSFPRITVPEGYYFVLGDNRKESRDSRYFGCVPKESICGVVSQFAIDNKDNVFLRLIAYFV